MFLSRWVWRKWPNCCQQYFNEFLECKKWNSYSSCVHRYCYNTSGRRQNIFLLVQVSHSSRRNFDIKYETELWSYKVTEKSNTYQLGWGNNGCPLCFERSPPITWRFDKPWITVRWKSDTSGHKFQTMPSHTQACK